MPISTEKAPIKNVLYLFLYCIAIQQCQARSWGTLQTRLIHASTSIRSRSFQCSTESNQHKVVNDDKDDNTQDQNDEEEGQLPAVSNLFIKSREEQQFCQRGEYALLRPIRSTVSNLVMVNKSAKKRRIKKVDTERELSSNTLSSEKPVLATSLNLHGGAATGALAARPLLFWENMVCGAISRSVAQTLMHPANTMKTMLQSRVGTNDIRSLLAPKNWHRLTVGAGANFILSVPHGAVNFAVLEYVRSKMSQLIPSGNERLGPGLDFVSSCISTICCSVVSTPQMMISDNIMAGNYPHLIAATKGLYRDHGIGGFYSGWFPGLAGKIPSYALTWTLFQQFKEAHRSIYKRDANDVENSIMGCVASATTVCIMIPLDTIKTRLVTQVSGPSTADAYKGIVDCAIRVYREEGMRTFYRGLAPRLISVVPMIGIQFGVYEFMKKAMRERDVSKKIQMEEVYLNGAEESFEEATIVAVVSKSQPFPNRKYT